GEVVPAPPVAQYRIERAITLDPTSAVEEIAVEGEDPDPKTGATRRRVTTLFRPIQTRTPNQVLANPFDALQSKFGLTLAPVDDVLRSQLEIAKGQGVVIVEVKPKSLAEQAGLKAKDVLLSLGDKEVAGVGAAKATLLGLGKEALEVKLIREGKARRMSLVGP